MRFNCPKPETYGQWSARIAKWHRIFALVPHRVEDGTCRWLEYVERRIELHNWYDSVDKVKYYRSVQQ